MRVKLNNKKGDTRYHAPSAEDQALFRQAMSDVKPLKTNEASAYTFFSKTKPVARTQPVIVAGKHPRFLAASPVATEVNEHLRWQRGGIQKKLMRKLYRGQLGCDAELDLHGLTVEQACTRLEHLLDKAKTRHFRCLLIIHGKGYRSGQRGPVLKAHLRGWLQACPLVLAYCSAPPQDGGTGAVYVLLRTKS